MPVEFLCQATAALFHTYGATAAISPAATSGTKSRTGVATVSKEPMYCWLHPVLFKPERGWLYQLMPASAEDKASAAKANTAARYLSM